MASQRRPACERKRTPQQPFGRRAVAGGQLDLGQPLQRMRRAGIGSHLRMQGKRLSEIGTGRVEVAGEQGRLAGHRHRERHPASCARPLGLLTQLARQGHHLVVGRRPVEQVLGDAQVRVEHRRGELRVLCRGAELTTEPVEPLAAVVGDHALEGDDVEQAVRRSRRQGHGASRLDRRVGAVDVTGEVGEHAPRQEDCAVVRAPARFKPGQCLFGRGEVPAEHRGASQPCPQARRLIGVGCRQCLAVGRNRGVVADRRQRIRPQRQQRRLRLTIDVITNGFGPAQHLRVEPGCCRYPRRLQRIRSGHRRLTPGQEKVGDLRRSGAEIDESGRDLVHDRWPQGRGDLRCQPGRDGWIGKSIPAGLDADHSGAERLVKQLTSGLPGRGRRPR